MENRVSRLEVVVIRITEAINNRSRKAQNRDGTQEREAESTAGDRDSVTETDALIGNISQDSAGTNELS